MAKRNLKGKIETLQKEILSLKRRLEKAKIQDDLTGLYKKAFFEMSLEREVYRAKRYKRIFSVIMVRLKNLKDERQLKEVTSLLKGSLYRDIDIAARFSRYCIILLLPETSHPRAISVGQRIKESITKALGMDVKVDVGVATYPYMATSKDELIYLAKKGSI